MGLDRFKGVKIGFDVFVGSNGLHKCSFLIFDIDNISAKSSPIFTKLSGNLPGGIPR